jgi:fatty-acyl-CoA synthase
VSDTLGEMLANGGRRHGDRPAWITPDGERTHREAIDNAARLADAFRAAGVVPGDRVAMMLDDVAEALEIFAGIVLAGMVVVAVNRAFKRDELDFILSDSGARALVYTDGATGAVERSAVCPGLALCLRVGSERYAEAVLPSAAPVAAIARKPEDPVMLAYTSGTTGFPKGAVISHRAMVTCIRACVAAYRIGNHARMANPGSLQFSAPWWALLLPHVYVGGFVRMLGVYTMDSWFEAMRRDDTTFTYVPSPLIPGFIEAGRRNPDVVERLEVVLHSSSTAPRDQIAKLVELVGDRFVEGYGMTETVGSVSVTTRRDMRRGCEADDVYASTGRPAPTATVALVGDDGRELPPGSEDVGELVVALDTLFSGYWNQPERTADVFDGTWFKTGDLARIDPAGYVYIVGRRSEVIITGGANVYPAEVERVLTGMQGVAECAVFGAPHERWGEAVTAAIVRAPGSDIDEASVLAYLGERVAGYKRPKAVVFVEELPRNASLKVQKHILRDRLVVRHPELPGRDNVAT